MTTTDIRPRRPEDIPALCEALAEQQSSSRYPYRRPYPQPLETFIVRDNEIASWTATVDGRPAGHVALTAVADGDDFVDVWTAAHACVVSELACVSVLFLRTDARGQGLGRGLLDSAVAHAYDHGLRPCLDVVDGHGAARHLYQRAGWVEVGRADSSWQTPEMPLSTAMVLPSSPLWTRSKH